MNNRQKTAFAAIFLALVFCVPVLTLLLPARDYSDLEKRALADAPTFSLESGTFSRAAESFFADHLPARETLIGADAYRKLFSGLQITGEVILENGALNEKPLARDDAKMLKNLERLAAFGEKIDKAVTLVTPPSAGAAQSGRSLLPYEDKEILSVIERAGPVALLPLYDAFVRDADALYYRTDPHWNARGAYLAYAALAEKLSFSPLPESAFAVEKSDTFRGTCYARAALWRFPADTLEMWDAGQNLRVTIDGETQDSLFYKKHLSAADQYPVFLDGNHGLTVIQNASCENGKRLLILKDSFGNSLAPLLAPHYAEIVLIDLRAYRLPVSDLAPFDDVIAVYSLDRLIHDDNFAWLK